MQIDFSSPDFIQDPYPVYRYLRESASPYWYLHKQSSRQTTLSGMWVFSRYADVLEILKATKLMRKSLQSIKAPGRRSIMDLHMLNRDPPDHTRLRGLIDGHFRSQAIDNMSERIGQIADELLDALASQKSFDFVADFALPFPMMVIGELLGVPRKDHGKLRQWSVVLAMALDSGMTDQDVFREQERVLRDFIGYTEELLAYRRAHPADDLLTHLLQAHDEGGELTHDELVSMVVLLIFAGHESTVDFLGCALVTLCRFPEQFELLRASPELLPSAIEELLRYESPTQRATFRLTAEACEIGGKLLQKGEQVTALINAANRDPLAFNEPDRFDINREPNRHLAFGAGIHVCSGQHLAKMEGRIAFARIIERMPGIRLRDKVVNWEAPSFFRRVATLPVVL